MEIVEKKISKVSKRHGFIASWVVVWLFFFFSFKNVGWAFALFHSFIVTSSMVVVCLVERHLFYKLFFDNGKKILFYLLSVVLVVGFSALFMQMQMSYSDFVQNFIPGTPKPDPNAEIDLTIPFIIRTLIYASVASITVITCLERNEQETQRLSNELKIENLNMELRYLKSQINPHFLFNALNNIYSLVYMKDEKAPESVLKLSEMLRYVMVDCQADTISIEKEMKFIDNYIDFQLMKLEDKRNISFEKNVKSAGYMIPPMIFQPIVENAFKYSRIENDPDGFIRFSVRQDDDGLEFVSENSIKIGSVMQNSLNTKTSGGIGVRNVTKRLSLHYKDKFSFVTNTCDNVFRVDLKILN